MKNSSVNRTFLGRLPIQNHTKEQILRNEEVNLTTESEIPYEEDQYAEPVKSLYYIKCYKSSNTKNIKILVILSAANQLQKDSWAEL